MTTPLIIALALSLVANALLAGRLRFQAIKLSLVGDRCNSNAEIAERRVKQLSEAQREVSKMKADIDSLVEKYPQTVFSITTN